MIAKYATLRAHGVKPYVDRRVASAVPTGDLPPWKAHRPLSSTDILRHGSPLAFVARQLRPMVPETVIRKKWKESTRRQREVRNTS